MSSAACRLPLGGTFIPLVWQERHRLSSLVWPDVAFSSWFLLSEVCGSWHFRQSRTAGGCTRPLIWVASLSAWQVRHSLYGVAVISLTCVASLLVRTSWQLVQPIAIAECTFLPLVLSSWQEAQSAPFGISTGCFLANAPGAHTRISRRNKTVLGEIEDLAVQFTTASGRHKCTKVAVAEAFFIVREAACKLFLDWGIQANGGGVANFSRACGFSQWAFSHSGTGEKPQ